MADAKLQLEGPHGILSLNGIAEMGRGVQSTSGVTGFGLPPLQTQWSEGAGSGATYRGTRVRPRDIDVPLHILGTDRADLKYWISEFAKTVTGGCVFRFIEPEGTSWYSDVRLVGGGSFIYGKDTIGKRELNTVITFRSGDPWWTSSEAQTTIIAQTVGGVNSWVTHWVNMPLTASQVFGDIVLTNDGDAPSYPLWSVRGPGTFEAISATGQSFKYATALDTDETLVVDTKTASVLVYTDSDPDNPVNGYGLLDPAPKFWTIPPGSVGAEVLMTGSTSASKITVTWSPRKWVVI